MGWRPESRPQREDPVTDPARLERAATLTCCGRTHPYRVGAPWAGSVSTVQASGRSSLITPQSHRGARQWLTGVLGGADAVAETDEHGSDQPHKERDSNKHEHQRSPPTGSARTFPDDTVEPVSTIGGDGGEPRGAVEPPQAVIAQSRVHRLDCAPALGRFVWVPRNRWTQVADRQDRAQRGRSGRFWWSDAVAPLCSPVLESGSDEFGP